MVIACFICAIHFIKLSIAPKTFNNSSHDSLFYLLFKAARFVDNFEIMT